MNQFRTDNFTTAILFVVACSVTASGSAYGIPEHLGFQNSIQAQFEVAVETGQLARAQRNLSQGASTDAAGANGGTALLWATNKHKIADMKFLIENGSNPNLVSDMRLQNGQAYSESPMHMAAELEDSSPLRLLLEAGGNPNLSLGVTENTPLHVAVVKRRINNIQLLLAHGARVDSINASGETPLHYAVNGRRYSIALFLLRQGANAEIRDRWGYSARDTVDRFGRLGVFPGSEDDKAYPALVAELAKRKH